MTTRGPLLATLAVLFLAIAGCSSPIDNNPGAPTPTPLANAETLVALQAVREAVNSRDTKFGGAYLDATGSILTVLVAGADEATLDEIRELIPHGANVVWLSARYSLAELQRISDEIVATWQQVGVEKIGSVSVDIIRNRVVVAFPTASPQLENEFKAKYGDAVVFSIEPAGSPL